MADLRLHNCIITDDSQRQLPRSQRQQLSTLGLLDSDTPITEAISGSPGERRIRGQNRARYAKKITEELGELVNASGFEAMALCGTNASTPVDGYYAGEEATVEAADPRVPEIHNYDIRLKLQGTRRTHFRAVRTDPSQPDPSHPFGSGTTAMVGIPSTASNVRWYDREATTTAASPASTRTGQMGDTDRYDAEAAPYDRPVLFYDVALGDTWPTACLVWDTRGVSNRTDSDGVVAWQRVFSSSHEFDGAVVLDNGILRVTLDDSAGTLAAERWDTSTSSWSAVSLPSSSWSPIIVDLDALSPAVTRGHVVFSDGTSRYALDMALHRGHDDVLWTIPKGESDPVPTGLQDLLDPIASESVLDAQPDTGLVQRTEVR